MNIIPVMKFLSVIDELFAVSTRLCKIIEIGKDVTELQSDIDQCVLWITV